MRLVTVLVGFALLLSGCSTSSGGSIADWEVAPDQELSADSQTIDLLVYERECASGQSAEGRIQPPDVDYRDEAVVVTIRVRPRSGGATCQGNPPTPYTLARWSSKSRLESAIYWKARAREQSRPAHPRSQDDASASGEAVRHARGRGWCPGKPSGKRAHWSRVATGRMREAQRSVCTQRGTLANMSKTVPAREFRTHLADLLDEVADRREHVTVTRRGRPAAVLVPVDEYEALEETAEILSDEDTLVSIRRGLDDLAAGEITSLDDVRAQHAARTRA